MKTICYLLSAIFSLLSPTLVQAQCTDTLVGERENLGLYGGTCHDLAFSKSANRIFAGIKSPLSLLYTDDTCKTWHTAFSVDSLEYECGQRGWGGSSLRVLTNQKGWLFAQTEEPVSGLSASAISFSNGDSASWKTAVDPYLLNNNGYIVDGVKAIALSEYYIVTACNAYFIKQDSTLKIDSLTITDVRTLIPGASTNTCIHSIALSNDVSGFPVYFAIDTFGYGSGINRELYKFDGNTATKINVPYNLNGIYNVFTHPAQNSGDTLFISGIDTITGDSKTYRSFDAGTNWTEIYTSPTAGFLKDVDYSLVWNNTLSNSSGIILFQNTNNYVDILFSIDLGNNWEKIVTTNSIVPTATISPLDTALVIAASPKNVAYSITGSGGLFVQNKNVGFEAINVLDISVGSDKSVVYLATNNGLAYTTAYSDTAIAQVDKWQEVYGQFPVNIDTSNTIEVGAISCVQVDGKNSLHVIAGLQGKGIVTTTTGVDGFSYIYPFDTISNDPITKDIAFLNSSVVLLVTNANEDSEAPAGNIWRSADSGYTWTNISPLGFSSGNTIAVGYANNDTVMYVGSGYGSIVSGNLWKSTDLGITWSIVNSGPTAYLDSTATNLPILDIAINPNDNDSIYLAAGSANYKYALIQSADGGLTYHSIAVEALQTFTSVIVKSSSPDTVYAANGREIFLYDVKNDSTSLIFRGYPGESIPGLANGSILVGTTTGFYGIFYDETADIVVSNKPVENLTENKITLFPNPASDVVSLNLLTPTEVLIEVFDIFGKLLISQSEMHLNVSELINIDVRNFCSGTYFIKVSHNNQIEYAKFILVKDHN